LEESNGTEPHSINWKKPLLITNKVRPEEALPARYYSRDGATKIYVATMPDGSLVVGVNTFSGSNYLPMRFDMARPLGSGPWYIGSCSLLPFAAAAFLHDPEGMQYEFAELKVMARNNPIFKTTEGDRIIWPDPASVAYTSARWNSPFTNHAPVLVSTPTS
jgi:hypothetical protein